jgi:hypothetical protein
MIVCVDVFFFFLKKRKWTRSVQHFGGAQEASHSN